jgi:Cd2+/Zn2+-exporting ATPase
MAKVHIELPVLLPQVEDHHDQCVTRLQEILAAKQDIGSVHLHEGEKQALLCLHYDPQQTTLEQVERCAKQAGVEVSKRYHHETWDIRGMDCADCARSIEHIMARVPGIISVSINYAAEKMRVEYDTQAVEEEKLLKQIGGMGYIVEHEHEDQHSHSGHGHSHGPAHLPLILILVSGLCLALGFLGQFFLHLPMPIFITLYIISYLSGGYDLARHSFSALRKFQFDIESLMLVAAIGAAVLGDWAEGALLLFLFGIGHALEHEAMDRARNAVQALGKLTPKTARVRREGREIEIPVNELLRGDTVILRPGDRIPIDGEIVLGASAVDQSPVTGESVPVEKKLGDGVFAGTVNGEGSLEITVTRLAKDTTLARVIQMVEEAETQKSPTQQTVERFSQFFVPSVLIATALVIVLPPLFGWLDWAQSFLRGMTILVAASPCALALGTPAAVLSGIGRAARNGVLIKGGVHLENLGRLTAIAFDKTGTITAGKPDVTDVLPAPEIEREELLRVAAAVECRSSHPLAQAVVRYAQQQQIICLETVADLQSVAGRGLHARLQDGREVAIGSSSLFAPEELSPEIRQTIDRLETQGKTTMIVRLETTILGVLGLADTPRAVAPAAIAHLKSLGLRDLIMLTGDHERVAAQVAAQVGMTDYRAEMLPENKVKAIKELVSSGRRVGMIGDGVNDAPALATATVGIAMGAGGTDVALETADVALMADDLSKLPFVIGLGRKTRAVIVQNLIISLGVIALLLPLAVFGLAGIGIAIVLHEGSTLLVVLNSLRLLGYRQAALEHSTLSPQKIER